jgi:hypothetical protein
MRATSPAAQPQQSTATPVEDTRRQKDDRSTPSPSDSATATPGIESPSADGPSTAPTHVAASLRDDDGSGFPLGLVLGVAAAAALAGATAWRVRRQRDTS